MPLSPSWEDIALRLLLTCVAGAVIGLDRGIRGHAAGLRTTILVALAASVAMIQANLLLSVTGKTADLFGVMDQMRLPLGILTGVGFIGAGTILRRGDLVTGVTTAATLWVVTVIGLCFGGGQLALGQRRDAVSSADFGAADGSILRMPRKQRRGSCRRIRPARPRSKPRRISSPRSAMPPILSREPQGRRREAAVF